MLWYQQENPLVLFARWFDEAYAHEPSDHNAMILATVDENNKPSTRVVLLKSWSQEEGFVFFTNYHSRKGQSMAAHNDVSLTFFWKSLYRQVHIEGGVRKTSRQVSEEYFAQRPKENQIAASVSLQSRSLGSFDDFTRQYEEVAQQYRGKASLPCPDHWGGYSVTPYRMEFWMGHHYRCHQRVLFTRNAASSSGWDKSFLYP